METRSLEVIAEKGGKKIKGFLDRLERLANGRFVHHPEYDPINLSWVCAFITYIIGTIFLMEMIPGLWPLIIYSYVVGVLMAFFSIRSQRRRGKMVRTSSVTQVCTGKELEAQIRD
jgi:hypothetical protein